MNRSEIPIVNPANIITLFRVVLVPFFLIALFGRSYYSQLTALIIFFVASLSDYFDGYFARKLNLHTRFGAFADPLADKLLVGSAFIAFLFLPMLHIAVWLVVLVLTREVFVTVMRIVAVRRGREMKTEYSGKIKTFFQMVTIFTILILLLIMRWNIERGSAEAGSDNFFPWKNIIGARGAVLLHHLPAIMVGITALLAVISMVHYILKNWRILAARDNSGYVS